MTRYGPPELLKPTAIPSLPKTGIYSVDKPNDISDVMEIVRINASKIYKTLGDNILTSKEELEGYGYLGLVDAYNTYSKEKYPKFNIYASFKVRGAIIDYLRTLNYSPSKYFKTIQKQVDDKIASGVDIEYDESGNTKTILNITKDGSESQVNMEYSAYLRLEQNNSKRFISLDAYLGDDNITKDTVTTQHSFITKQTIEDVLKLSKGTLNKKEYYIITEQFFKETSAQDIAKALKISPSRVSQIRSSALEKLKMVCILNGVTYGI